MGIGDRVRALFKPRRAVDTRVIDRMVEQAADRVLRRALDVADTPAWTESWISSTGALNDDLEAGLAVSVSRSRDLTRNNDWARGFLIRLRSAVLGPRGMTLQVRMGESARASAEAVEAFWRGWGRRGNCEVTGKLNWRQCERLMLDHWARDGEILVRLLPGRGAYGFQIQVLDPQVLDVTCNGKNGANRIRMGVEIDADGRPVAYWLNASGGGGRYMTSGNWTQPRLRVPAEEILHHFITEEAGQLRGLPWLVSGARRLWLVKDFEQSAAVASSNAAKRVGFFAAKGGESADAAAQFADKIVSDALAAAQESGRILTPAEVRAITTAAQKFNTVAPGQYDTLPAGYEFVPHDSQFPHVNYGEYIKECIRGFANGVGMSYVTAGNNLEAVNFSSARVGILDERELFKLLQEDMAESVHDRLFGEALRYGLLAAPELAGFPLGRYGIETIVAGATWQKRRWAGIDPLKEANANGINLANRLNSPQRIILERGDDPDEIADEIAQWEARFGQLRGSSSPRAAASGATQSDSDDDDQDPEDDEEDLVDETA